MEGVEPQYNPPHRSEKSMGKLRAVEPLEADESGASTIQLLDRQEGCSDAQTTFFVMPASHANVVNIGPTPPGAYPISTGMLSLSTTNTMPTISTPHSSMINSMLKSTERAEVPIIPINESISLVKMQHQAKRDWRNTLEQFVRMDPDDNIFLLGWNGNKPLDLKGIIHPLARNHCDFPRHHSTFKHRKFS